VKIESAPYLIRGESRIKSKRFHAKTQRSGMSGWVNEWMGEWGKEVGANLRVCPNLRLTLPKTGPLLRVAGGCRVRCLSPHHRCGINTAFYDPALNKCGRLFVREATPPFIPPQGGTYGGKLPFPNNGTSVGRRGDLWR